MGWYRVRYFNGYTYTRLSSIDDRLCRESEKILNIIIDETVIEPLKTLYNEANDINKIILSYLPTSSSDVLEVRFTQFGVLILWI